MEPIAVVGMSCRLPGTASDTQKLWELLTQGRSAWGKTPKDRFNQQGFHDSSSDVKAGTVWSSQDSKMVGLLLTTQQTNTDGGHFLKDDVKAFDASFFGISPVEATVSFPTT